MNENIDLTKILKDCPKGKKLYSPIFGEVIFERIGDKSEIYPIKVKYYSEKYDRMDEVSFTKEGLFLNITNTECTLFPSKDQRDWSKFKAPWYKKERFDPKTLNPFDGVLMRNGSCDYWSCYFFPHIIDGNDIYKYIKFMPGYKCCIPYNEETKHLLGTKEEAPEYYRYWED